MTQATADRRCSLLSVSAILPPHAVTVRDTKQLMEALVGADSRARWQAMVDSCGVETRYVVQPIDDLLRRSSIAERSQDYERAVVELAAGAAAKALHSANVAPSDVASIVSVSCTGYMLPSLDCHLVERLRLPRRVRRIPLTELGCSAGVGALAIASRSSDFSEGYTLLVTAEPCSLCLRLDAPATSDLLGAMLFGDGAAGAVLGMDDAAAPRVLATASEVWPELADQLGMRLDDAGFRFVLSPRLPTVVRDRVRSTVAGFVAGCGLTLESIDFWVIHPGGPRILNAIGEALELNEPELRPSWEVWTRYGNVSSATVFLILRHLALTSPPSPGALGLMIAFGPGITCEMALVSAGGWLTKGCYS